MNPLVTPPDADACVSVRGLTKRHGACIAVRDMSFTINRGEIFGLLGPNGAGKTSTLECLAGLRPVDAGQITIGGLEAERDGRAIKEKIGVMLQATALQDKITPREALTLFASFYQHAASPEKLIHRFSLGEKADAPFASLSGGQRQRLALALAFVNEPEFLLLDEPTAGLDPAARRGLHAEIRQLRSEGRTVLLSTHDLAEAQALCDRIAVLDKGVLLAVGSPAALAAEASAQLEVTLVTTPPLPVEQLAALPGIMRWNAATPTQFSTIDPQATLAGISALVASHGVTLRELQIRPATLEEFFLRLTSARTAPSAR